MSRVASVDIGSNTLLLLVAELDGELSAVREECRFGRLGKGIDESGALASDSIERSLAILREYRAITDELGVSKIGAVGTQALREASNSDSFVGPAREILGAEIEIIAGEREAELVYRAVCESFPGLVAGDLVIADVGGGSTEIIVGSEHGVQSFTSVPIGAVRMSERHLRSDPATREQTAALISDIDAALEPLELPSGVPLIGTAGTATTFATVEQKLPEYDPTLVHGFALSGPQVERQLARFLELSVGEKRRLPGLEPERADVIAGGAAIYARLLRRIGAPDLIVSDRGVRWGLAHELA